MIRNIRVNSFNSKTDVREVTLENLLQIEDNIALATRFQRDNACLTPTKPLGVEEETNTIICKNISVEFFVSLFLIAFCKYHPHLSPIKK